MSRPAFPPSGKYLESITASCKALRESQGLSITEASIKQLLLSPAFTGSFERVSQRHGLAMPLNFPNPGSELNLLSILALLNFASGYRAPLHAETGYGAWNCMKAFVLSLFIVSSVDEDLLSARGMKDLKETKVAELMRINVHVERPHETLQHITLGELGGPLYELVQLVTQVLNETGQILVDSGYVDLGMFVVEALKEGKRAITVDNPSGDIEVVLEKLVRAFPAFRDMAVVRGHPVFCFKKALFLIHSISLRFGSLNPPPFHVPSTSRLPIFTDNVIPSMLIHLGVIDISQSPELSSVFPDAGNEAQSLLATAGPGDDGGQGLPKDGPVLTTEQAYILRAAAVDACEMISRVAQSLDHPKWMKEVDTPALDMWLWAVAKDRKDYRQLERFVLQNTVFF